MEVIKRLAGSRKFWLAMLALAQSILFGMWPNFPPAIWQNIDAVLIVLITMIAIEDSAQGFGAATAASRVEIARIQAGAVVSAAAVTVKPALATPAMVAEVPVTPTEKVAVESTR
jgi:hypothetical protein